MRVQGCKRWRCLCECWLCTPDVAAAYWASLMLLNPELAAASSTPLLAFCCQKHVRCMRRHVLMRIYQSEFITGQRSRDQKPHPSCKVGHASLDTAASGRPAIAQLHAVLPRDQTPAAESAQAAVERPLVVLSVRDPALRLRHPTACSCRS